MSLLLVKHFRKKGKLITLIYTNIRYMNNQLKENRMVLNERYVKRAAFLAAENAKWSATRSAIFLSVF